MTLTGILDREQPEPEESSRAIPLPMMSLIVLMTAFGIYYYVHYGNSSAFVAETPKAPPTPTSKSVATAPPAGEKLFKSRCAACHQADGKGLQGAFPPLAGSEWVTAKPELVTGIVMYGLSGEIVVSGRSYRGQMPSFQSLSDSELASILTYIRSSWGNEGDPISSEQVTALRELERESPWAGEEELTQHFGELDL